MSNNPMNIPHGPHDAFLLQLKPRLFFKVNSTLHKVCCCPETWWPCTGTFVLK